MTRYITKGYIADDCVFDERQTAPAMTVIESDDRRDTGLVAIDGNKIYRVREAVGFISRG